LVEVKDSIRRKIYNELAFTVNYGFGTYSEKRLADTVWNLLNNYGFGSIERIINWFDTEERKELMANIVLNNKGYAERLGFGNETRLAWIIFLRLVLLY
jgi:tRNA(Ile)-lysidine synthase TilS/MesJ